MSKLKKLSEGKIVQLNPDELIDLIGNIQLSHSNSKKINKALNNNCGCRIQLDEIEIEGSGLGKMFSKGKKLYKKGKKLNDNIKENTGFDYGNMAGDYLKNKGTEYIDLQIGEDNRKDLYNKANQAHDIYKNYNNQEGDGFGKFMNKAKKGIKSANQLNENIKNRTGYDVNEQLQNSLQNRIGSENMERFNRANNGLNQAHKIYKDYNNQNGEGFFNKIKNGINKSNKNISRSINNSNKNISRGINRTTGNIERGINRTTGNIEKGFNKTTGDIEKGFNKNINTRTLTKFGNDTLNGLKQANSAVNQTADMLGVPRPIDTLVDVGTSYLPPGVSNVASSMVKQQLRQQGFGIYRNKRTGGSFYKMGGGFYPVGGAVLNKVQDSKYNEITGWAPAKPIPLGFKTLN